MYQKEGQIQIGRVPIWLLLPIEFPSLHKLLLYWHYDITNDHELPTTSL